MAGVIPLEAIFDLLAAELDNHWPAVGTGIGVRTVVECRQEVDDRALGQRGVAGNRWITGQIRQQLVDRFVDGLGSTVSRFDETHHCLSEQLGIKRRAEHRRNGRYLDRPRFALVGLEANRVETLVVLCEQCGLPSGEFDLDRFGKSQARRLVADCFLESLVVDPLVGRVLVDQHQSVVAFGNQIGVVQLSQHAE